MSTTSVLNKSLPICNTDNLQAIFTKPALTLYLSTALIACLIVIITIALNCTFLATMLFQSRMQRSISNKLLMTLSTTDLLIGILVWPLIAATSFINYNVDIKCHLSNVTIFLGYHFVLVTLSTVFLVAVEQYLAIIHPYLYISQVTFHRLIYPMLISTSLLLLINMIVIITYKEFWLTYLQIFFVPIGVIIVGALIYMHKKIIECASRVAANINNTNKEEGRQMKSRAKAAKSSLIILVGTLVCYLPIICCNIYEKIFEQTSYSVTFFSYPSHIIAMGTSVLDPVVYYWRLRSLRRATRDMFSSIRNIENQVECVSKYTSSTMH